VAHWDEALARRERVRKDGAAAAVLGHCRNAQRVLRRLGLGLGLRARRGLAGGRWRSGSGGGCQGRQSALRVGRGRPLQQAREKELAGGAARRAKLHAANARSQAGVEGTAARGQGAHCPPAPRPEI
jgi:hypothetical protein